MPLKNFISTYRHIIRRLIGLAFMTIPCILFLVYLEISWFIILLLCLITASCFWCIDYIPFIGIPSKFFSGFTYFTLLFFLHIVAFIFIFAYIYTQKGIIKNGNYINFANQECDASIPIVRDYSTCLYFSTVTFTTLGYGDFHPAEGTRGVAALESMVGFLFLGFFVGMVAYQLHIINKRHLSDIRSKSG